MAGELGGKDARRQGGKERTNRGDAEVAEEEREQGGKDRTDRRGACLINIRGNRKFEISDFKKEKLHHFAAVYVLDNAGIKIFIRNIRKIRKILRQRRGEFAMGDAEVCPVGWSREGGNVNGEELLWNEGVRVDLVLTYVKHVNLTESAR